MNRMTSPIPSVPSEMASPVPLLGTQPELSGVTAGGSVGVAILGSTGSIGQQALDVISHLPDRFTVVALAAGHDSELLRGQVREFRPKLVATSQPSTEALSFDHVAYVLGADGLIEAATHPDASIVVMATSGHAAIRPTLAAIEAGKTIALANKETIVCAGELVVQRAVSLGVQIRPVDSEHSALWQSLIGARRADIAMLHLTASGGPFREFSARDLEAVKAEHALNHPTWKMGDKVTIDSATLMNKGLEVLEAHWLFGIPLDQINVVIHPESIVHSLIEFADRSQLAQLSLPDMRLPIQFALTYPHHVASPCRPLSLPDLGTLTFAAPDDTRFPALALARSAGKQGGTYPTVLSAADEVAVHAFLNGHITFPGIMSVVDTVVSRHQDSGTMSIDAILEADRWARATAAEHIARRRG